MKEVWNWILVFCATLGGVIGAFVGEIDGFFTVLVAFVILDFLSGLLRSAYEKRLSSAIGFRGICKKMAIFIMVAIAHMIDSSLIGYNGILRTAVVFFYVANEGISILENLAAMDVAIPKKLKEILLQLRKKGDSNGGNDDEKSSD